MQAEIQTKVKISVSEIKKILAEKFCLYHEFELEFVEDSVVESKTVKEENNKWIDVPNTWENSRCPTDFDTDTKIDVMQRSGRVRYNVDVGTSVIKNSSLWAQEGWEEDIVKYRVSEQSN